MRVAARCCARSKKWSRSVNRAMDLTRPPKPDPPPEAVQHGSAAGSARADAPGARGARCCRGERNDYNDLLDEAFRCLLDVHAGGGGATAADGEGTATKRSAHAPSVVLATITKCEGCGQAWQLAAGRKIALTPAELEAAECDAVHIGSLDGAPQRATSTIPRQTRSAGEAAGQLQVHGAVVSVRVNIEVHHIMHREHGGGHEPENLTSLCWRASRCTSSRRAADRGPRASADVPAAGTRSPTWGTPRGDVDEPVPHVGDRERALRRCAARADNARLHEARGRTRTRCSARSTACGGRPRSAAARCTARAALRSSQDRKRRFSRTKRSLEHGRWDPVGGRASSARPALRSVVQRYERARPCTSPQRTLALFRPLARGRKKQSLLRATSAPAPCFRCSRQHSSRTCLTVPAATRTRQPRSDAMIVRGVTCCQVASAPNVPTSAAPPITARRMPSCAWRVRTSAARPSTRPTAAQPKMPSDARRYVATGRSTVFAIM